MSAVHSLATKLERADYMAPPLAGTWQMRSLVVGGIFAIASIVGAFIDPEHFYPAYLIAYMGWLGLTLGCMVMVMLVHLTNGRWGQVVRRMWEAGSHPSAVLMFAVLFLPIWLGRQRLYLWLQPEQVAKNQHLKEITQTYLTQNGFALRAALYFAIWALLSILLSHWSAQQDTPGGGGGAGRFRSISAPGILVYGFTVSFAAIDWVMSLDPTWISTIYGLIFVIGEALFAVCLVVIVEAILEKERPLSELMRTSYIHDHGKLTLAFVMVWAYFNFSQWLIIWAGNLPDEITYFFKRLHGGWQYVGLMLALFHFCAPFLLLLSRSFKRKTSILIYVSIWLVFMRFVDLYWMIEPNFNPQMQFHLSWLDVVIPIGMGGLWFALFFHNLRARPMVPLYAESTQMLLAPAHEGH